jgi:hypothetical protein
MPLLANSYWRTLTDLISFALTDSFVLLEHKVSISELEIPLVPRKINIHVCHPEVPSFIYHY